MPVYTIKVSKGKLDENEVKNLKKEIPNLEEIAREVEERVKGFEDAEFEVTIFADRASTKYILKAPPISELVKKVTKLDKLSSKEDSSKIVGDISMEDIKRIAELKKDELLGRDEKTRIKQVIGAISSYKITIDGKDPREVLKGL